MKAYPSFSLNLCRLGQQQPLCDSIELIENVDESRLQEGLSFCVVVRLGLLHLSLVHILGLGMVVCWPLERSMILVSKEVCKPDVVTIRRHFKEPSAQHQPLLGDA